MQTLANGIHKLELASNTLLPFTTTNSFIIENQGVAILIDPGFNTKESVALVQLALEQVKASFLKAIVLTHTHNDHIDGISLIKEKHPDLSIYVHPNEYTRVEDLGNIKALNDGRNVMIGDKIMQAIFTPGHSPGHLSFYFPEETLAIVGDLVAGKGSTWIGLPEGNIAEYFESIERLRTLKLTQLEPGHGDSVKDPYNKLNEMRQHRLARLEQISNALKQKALSLTELRQAVYPDVPDAISAMADSSLLALLEYLMTDMKVMHAGQDEQGPYILST